jgi:hypothetical protein
VRNNTRQERGQGYLRYRLTDRSFAQSLAIRGARRLKTLIKSVNEGWDNSIALTKPRPQPDYVVGFKRTVFTKDQLKKI